MGFSAALSVHDAVALEMVKELSYETDAMLISRFLQQEITKPEYAKYTEINPAEPTLLTSTIKKAHGTTAMAIATGTPPYDEPRRLREERIKLFKQRYGQQS